MDIYNKYVWIEVTDVHEPFLETADRPGCSASGKPADDCCKQWVSCTPALVWQLQQVTTPQSTVSTPWLGSWKKKKSSFLEHILLLPNIWRLLDGQVYHHFILST